MKKKFAVILAFAALFGMFAFAGAAQNESTVAAESHDSFCSCYPFTPELDVDIVAGGGSVVRCLRCGTALQEALLTNGYCDCPPTVPMSLECDPLANGECRVYCLGCGRQFYPAN